MKTDPRNYPQEIIPDLISYLTTLERKGIKSIYHSDRADADEPAVSVDGVDEDILRGYSVI